MKLIVLSSRKREKPPMKEDWQPLNIGISVNESRAISYATVFSFFIIVSFLFMTLKADILNDISLVRETLGIGTLGISILVFLAIVLTTVIHELLHLIAFPMRNLQKSLFICIVGVSPCFLYNSKISRARFLWVLVSPFIFLTPIYIYLTLAFSGLISALLLFTHISSCFGDLVLFFKLSRRSDVTHLWSYGDQCWAIQKNM